MWFVNCFLMVLSVAGVSVLALPDDTFQTLSERPVPISVIRQYLPRISEEHVPHVVFEYRDDCLISHHARLPLRLMAEETAVFSEDKQFKRGNQIIDLLLQNSTTSFALQGHGYTFVFDGLPNRLIAAWGPELQLHAIDGDAYVGLFLNFVTRNSPTIITVDGVLADLTAIAMKKALDYKHRSKAILPSIKQEACPKKLSFEIAIGYDASFCALNKNSELDTEKALKGLVLHISKIFEKAACVTPLVIISEGFCHSRVSVGDFDRFARPSAFETNCSGDINNPDCEKNSQIMLELSVQEWAKTVSSSAHRDAAFLFTGYGDDTPLAGATYRAAACSDKLSFAWVEGSNPVVFAHEVGHMLGASHDIEGIMTPKVRQSSTLVLSENSTALLRRFVNKDPRSWCLEQNYHNFGTLQNEFQWNYPEELLLGENRHFSVLDMTVVSPDQTASPPTLLCLISEKNENDHSSLRSLSLLVIANMSCSDYGKCTLSEEAKENMKQTISFPLNHSQDSFGFGIAFAQVQQKGSRDLIISHLRTMNGQAEAFYQIGYNFDSLDTAPKSWSKQHRLPKFNPENVQCSSIAVAHIRGGPTPDLLLVIVDKKVGKNIIQYRIGYDLGPDGAARGGWSPLIDVKGWYGRDTTSVAIFVTNLDESGRPDLVLYHVDNTPGMKIGSIRIGKDLNTTGHVTGGWTKFIQVLVLNPYSTERFGTMAVAHLGGRYMSLISVQRETQLFGREVWNLYSCSQILIPNYLKATEERPALTELHDGCVECYNPESAQKCVMETTACGARVDEVSLENESLLQLPDFEGKKSSREYEEGLQPNLGRPPHADVESIYCAGFHYLYSTNQSCDVFDRPTVLGKGVVIEFEKALKEVGQDTIENVTSKSLFEDPAGVSDNDRKNTVAVIEIVGKNLGRAGVIERAIRKLNRLPDFRSFIFSRQNVNYIRKGNRYFVHFRLNANHK